LLLLYEKQRKVQRVVFNMTKPESINIFPRQVAERFEEAKRNKIWGAITVYYQAGFVQYIEEKKTMQIKEKEALIS